MVGMPGRLGVIRGTSGVRPGLVQGLSRSRPDRLGVVQELFGSHSGFVLDSFWSRLGVIPGRLGVVQGSFGSRSGVVWRSYEGRGY